MSFDLDGLPPALLTTGNPKTAKGEGSGYLTAIMHLAPASLSGRNVCPHASAACIAACLNTAGRGGIGLDADGLNMIQAARIRRTRFFQRDREAFMAQLASEIRKHVKSAERHGLIPAVRLNGTSDLPWERFPIEGQPHIFAAFPGVTFYDYTKFPIRLRPLVASIPNYSLTFSLSESNDERAREALEAGVNVAAVFDVRRSGDLPASFELSGMSYPVLDGDKTDLRFTDPSGYIVGLRAKGRAVRDRTGFVRTAN
jgi:hypothetical protein